MASQSLRFSEGSTKAPPAPVPESMPQPSSCRNAAPLPATCTNCGFEWESTHRLRHDGKVRHFCTSCILLLHKGMYCSLCHRVYEKSSELGDPSLWLTCSKCQRLSHLECASDHDLPTSSMFFTCGFCSKSEVSSSKGPPTSTAASVDNGGPPSKKLRLQGKHASPEEAVVAAQIVAFLAVYEAKDARTRARATASLAAMAVARAKSALDSAYRIAQEDARWRAECSSRFPALVAAKSQGLPLSAGQDTSRNGREEGTAFVPVPPNTMSRALPHKEHAHLGNSKFSTQHYKPKVSQPVFESSKPLMSYPEASAQGLSFQKPPRVSVQEGGEQSQTSAESEVAVVSASPASILDAASSLDGLQLNKVTAPRSAGVGLHGGAVVAKTSNFSPLAPPVSGSLAHSFQPPLSKDQSQITSKTQITENDSASPRLLVKRP